MKALALAASGLLLMAPCERPPERFQGESVPAVVYFADPMTVHIVCAEASGQSGVGYQILACTRQDKSIMLLPDPCLFEGEYAALVCHERSHLMRADGSPGWPGDHPA